MDQRELSDAEVAEFAKNMAHRFASHEVEYLDAADADRPLELIGVVLGWD